jgi:hypothetical protein
MFQKTGSNYGVNEVLLSSVLGAVVFSLFAAQPLVIVGVTGNLTSAKLRRHAYLTTQMQALSPSLISKTRFYLNSPPTLKIANWLA